jgi:hypothetical protein
MVRRSPQRRGPPAGHALRVLRPRPAGRVSPQGPDARLGGEDQPRLTSEGGYRSQRYWSTYRYQHGFSTGSGNGGKYLPASCHICSVQSAVASGRSAIPEGVEARTRNCQHADTADTLRLIVASVQCPPADGSTATRPSRAAGAAAATPRTHRRLPAAPVASEPTGRRGTRTSPSDRERKPSPCSATGPRQSTPDTVRPAPAAPRHPRRPSTTQAASRASPPSARTPNLPRSRVLDDGR